MQMKMPESLIEALNQGITIASLGVLLANLLIIFWPLPHAVAAVLALLLGSLSGYFGWLAYRSIEARYALALALAVFLSAALLGVIL